MVDRFHRLDHGASGAEAEHAVEDELDRMQGSTFVDEEITAGRVDEELDQLPPPTAFPSSQHSRCWTTVLLLTSIIHWNHDKVVVFHPTPLQTMQTENTVTLREAATLLGINKRGVRYRCERLGIARERRGRESYVPVDELLCRLPVTGRLPRKETPLAR